MQIVECTHWLPICTPLTSPQNYILFHFISFFPYLIIIVIVIVELLLLLF